LEGSEVSTFTAADGIRRLRLDGRALLFHEDRRELLELNETADFIWTGLSRGEPPGRVAAGLSALGAAPAAAERYVDEAAKTWTHGGRLLPSRVVQKLATNVKPVRLRLGELEVEVALHDVEGAWLEPLVGAFPEVRARARRKLAAVAFEDGVYLFLDGRFNAFVDAQALAPQVKSLLTSLYADSVSEGFLAHAAGLVSEGKTLMLSGRPGAGKTTLAMTLLSGGWTFASDDIVRVRPDGRVEGAPFAAAVKSGSWDLLAQDIPQLRAMRPWVRPDGQAVRYVRAKTCDPRPKTLGCVVLLERTPGATARLETLGAIETLTAILDSAWSPRARLEGPVLEAVAGAVNRAGRYRLVYDRLESAVERLAEVGLV
jgi:hypothetical protein